MPVLLRSGPYKVFFYSNEGTPREPKHVHVRTAGKEAKVWLNPGIELAANRGFNSKELADIISLVDSHKLAFEAAWDEHFRD